MFEELLEKIIDTFKGECKIPEILLKSPSYKRQLFIHLTYFCEYLSNLSDKERNRIIIILANEKRDFLLPCKEKKKKLNLLEEEKGFKIL